jgi:hypothetical protein
MTTAPRTRTGTPCRSKATMARPCVAALARGSPCTQDSGGVLTPPPPPRGARAARTGEAALNLSGHRPWTPWLPWTRCLSPENKMWCGGWARSTGWLTRAFGRHGEKSRVVRCEARGRRTGVVDRVVGQSTADELLGRSGGRWGSGACVCVWELVRKRRSMRVGCQGEQFGLGQEDRKRRQSQMTALVSSV